MELVSPTLQGGLLTAEPPGKSPFSSSLNDVLAGTGEGEEGPGGRCVILHQRELLLQVYNPLKYPVLSTPTAACPFRIPHCSEHTLGQFSGVFYSPTTPPHTHTLLAQYR